MIKSLQTITGLLPIKRGAPQIAIRVRGGIPINQIASDYDLELESDGDETVLLGPMTNVRKIERMFQLLGKCGCAIIGAQRNPKK